MHSQGLMHVDKTVVQQKWVGDASEQENGRHCIVILEHQRHTELKSHSVLIHQDRLRVVKRC
jgi:hypothetical protein